VRHRRQTRATTSLQGTSSPDAVSAVKSRRRERRKAMR
jgi:hypothetical protein